MGATCLGDWGMIMRYVMKKCGDEPAITQYTINGLKLSWNPDDGRFYVVKGEVTVATFKAWNNAVYYCKTH